jgi:hypothetical protein
LAIHVKQLTFALFSKLTQAAYGGHTYNPNTQDIEAGGL